MAIIHDSENRRVIPNWRRLGRTVRLGELGSVGARQIRTFTKEDIKENLISWGNNKTVAHAGDLLSSAFVTDLTHIPEVKEAANFIVNHTKSSPKPLVNTAKRILTDDREEESFLDVKSIQALKEIHDDDFIEGRISHLKSSIHKFPHNSIKRVELSRLYSLLGQDKPASKSMKIALNLDPNNRFVLRSAARLFIHLREFEVAHAPLRNSKATEHDPWLLSAEIALSTIRERHSTFAKTGFSKIESDNFSEFDTAELTSSLATLELYNGAHKNAKKLFRDSLVQPNDNALAQYEWASNFDKRLSGFVPQNSVPNPYEALALENYHEGNWEEALENSVKWLLDLPFSKRPVNLGSFIAVTYLEDFDVAEQLCRAGLYANPNNPSLLNNLAFSLASKGNVEGALDVMNRIDKVSDEKVSRPERIALTATKGLIHYKVGSIEYARNLYKEAIEQAGEIGNEYYQSLAFLNFLREELQLSKELSNAKELVSKVDNFVSKNSNRHIQWLKKMIFNKYLKL